MLNIDYVRGLGQSVIETATFNLDNEKQLKLTIVDVHDLNDGEKVIGQHIKLSIKDNSFGEEELYIEIDIKDGTDLIRILQRLCRQMANPRSIVPSE